MKNLLVSFVSVFIIIVMQVSSFPQNQNVVIPSKTVPDYGADVKVFVNYNRVFSGELLSVRENSLMILDKENCDALMHRAR